jgi:hypothetical protein
MANLKTLFQKRILDLMSEVDEEKKIRLNMQVSGSLVVATICNCVFQVEIDRIKKLTLNPTS